MKKKIKLFGRKKLILSLYEELDRKEKEIKEFDNVKHLYQNEIDALKKEIISYKCSENIANDLIGDIDTKMVVDNNSFLKYYQHLFTKLELLSSKEYKNFVELLLFDKKDVFPAHLKKAIMCEYIRQSLLKYNKDFYNVPLHFNDSQLKEIYENNRKLISVNNYDINSVFKDHKNKLLTDNLTNFDSMYDREINFINNIKEITNNQIIFYKDRIISYIGQLLTYSLFEFNDSINDYYFNMTRFLYRFDYSGFLNWEKSINNELSAKSFRNTLIKNQWISLNKINNNLYYNFVLEYPNDYTEFINNYGKQQLSKQEYINKFNIIVKGTNKEINLYKSSDYYAWLLSHDNQESWNDNIILTTNEIETIINYTNTNLIKVYGISYDLSNTDDTITNILKKQQINVDFLNLDNEFLIKKIFFYFVYYNRHK